MDVLQYVMAACVPPCVCVRSFHDDFVTFTARLVMKSLYWNPAFDPLSDHSSLLSQKSLKVLGVAVQEM